MGFLGGGAVVSGLKSKASSLVNSPAITAILSGTTQSGGVISNLANVAVKAMGGTGSKNTSYMQSLGATIGGVANLVGSKVQKAIQANKTKATPAELQGAVLENSSASDSTQTEKKSFLCYFYCDKKLTVLGWVTVSVLSLGLILLIFKMTKKKRRY